MKAIIFVLVSLFFSCGAYADTTASLGGYYGYVPNKKNGTFNLGFSFAVPIIKGVGWWTWNGLGSTAKDEEWVSHVQGLDFSYHNVTTTLQYKISKDPNVFTDSKIKFEQEVGVKVKVKLW
jgi:hypothetical protein